MIEQLYNDIIQQITPPEYKYTALINERTIRFTMNKDIDLSHINTTDPVAKILVDNCIRVHINDREHKCEIVKYKSEHKRVVMDRIGEYLLHFLRRHTKQKNPQATKLYKWLSHYSDRYDTPTGADVEYMMLFRYLNANLHNADSEVHINNGIGILETLKRKYEAQGYKLEERHERKRRRRSRW